MQFESPHSADDAHAERSALLAKAGKIELEYVESKASGTLHEHAAHLKQSIEEVLPKLQELTGCDEDTEEANVHLQEKLQKFLSELS